MRYLFELTAKAIIISAPNVEPNVCSRRSVKQQECFRVPCVPYEQKWGPQNGPT